MVSRIRHKYHQTKKNIIHGTDNFHREFSRFITLVFCLIILPYKNEDIVLFLQINNTHGVMDKAV